MHLTLLFSDKKRNMIIPISQMRRLARGLEWETKPAPSTWTLPAAVCIGIRTSHCNSVSSQVAGSSRWTKYKNNPSVLSELTLGLPKAVRPSPNTSLYHRDRAGAPPATAPILLTCKQVTLESFWSKESLWFLKRFLIYWNTFPSKEVAIPTLNWFSKTPVFLFSPCLSDSYQLALRTFSTESSPAEISCCCS